MTSPTTIVIPTLGRPSLTALLQRLASLPGTLPPIVLVDDRPGPAQPLDLPTSLDVRGEAVVVRRSGGRGPAAARNVGWRVATTPWVSFLDDDVLPDEDWLELLAADLAAAPLNVAGSQGRVWVPLPADRRPTDWERGTAGLATATWITADMSYRRPALAAVGGFDERFPRAYREDADLGLRVVASRGAITQGSRRIAHPVRPTGWWTSLRQQAGNADDVLMRRLHGRDWRRRALAPAGRRGRHLATVGSGAVGLVAVAAGNRHRRLAVVGAAGWALGIAEFVARRIAPGPGNPVEVAKMVTTSVAIPPAAVWHTARGLWQHRRTGPWRGLPELVLFDRDGTLVENVPYNGDPAQVRPVDGAAEAVSALRERGVKVGVVTNQSGIGSGRISIDDVKAVNRRVDELLGPFDVWEVCPHTAADACGCRKPAPGMVKAACRETGVDPAHCVLVGDIGSDVDAAEAAGAVGVLVPTAITRPEEIDTAAVVYGDVGTAVAEVLRCHW